MSSRQLAVALRYLHKMDPAPRVAAKGWGYVAEKIVDIAKKQNVPVHHDRDLAEVLIKLDIGESIPEELYKVVAEILAFIYKTNKGMR